MEKSELVSLLRNDLEGFKSIREENPYGEMDLSGVDLSGCNLVGAPLAGINLKNANLRGADCTGAVFRFSDLSGADFTDAKLEDTTLHQATLEGANLDGVTLGGIERDLRLCLHVSAFKGTRWGREELETMLGILNQNQSWEIRYELVPKSAS